jgi:hypothetical protein
MSRTTEDPKTEVITFRVTPKMKNALKAFSEESECSLSEAAVQTIQYGILYYYYVKEEN